MQSSHTTVPPGTSTSSIYYPPAKPEEEDYIVEQKAPASSAQIFGLSIVQNLTQFCLGGVIIFSLLIPISLGAEGRPFTQHIVLCTVGYFLLMAQAILSFSPVGWANNVKYDNQKTLFNIMQILGSILAIAGCCVPLFYNAVPIFFSAHGICGFIAMLFTILNLIAGVLALIFHGRANKLMKIVYSSLGTVTMTTAFIAVILAFDLNYRFMTENAFANLSIITTVFALIGVLLLYLFKIIKHVSE